MHAHARLAVHCSLWLNNPTANARIGCTIPLPMKRKDYDVYCSESNEDYTGCGKPLSSACLKIFVSNFEISASPLPNVGTASYLKMARLEKNAGRLSAEILRSCRRRIGRCVVRGLKATKITAARAAQMMYEVKSLYTQTNFCLFFLLPRS